MAFAIFRARQSETQRTPVKEEEWFNNSFKQIWESGIYVSKTDAKRNYASEVLEEDGLRMMKYDEVLKEMSRRPNFRKALEGKLFHIDGAGSISGYGIFDGRDGMPVPDYYTFNDKAELTNGKSDIWKTVQVYRGRHPLVFYVPMEHAVNHIGANFIIYANQPPSQVMSVVVGVKKEAKKEPEQAKVEGNAFDSLLRVA